jgi:ral guanine nucleotide dissociation stimulator-like 1
MATKYWGEERQPNAIYAVYLKKVRYVPPSGYEGLPHYRPIDPDSHFLEPEMGSDHLQWETIRERIIKAGTLEKLVESLIGAEDKMDSRHFNVFFATYRAYAQPEAVLDKLLKWFESLDHQECGSNSSVTTQSSIRSILICWLDMYPEDFYDSEAKFTLLARLIDFCRNHSLNDLKHRARKLRDRFKRIAEEGGLACMHFGCF